MISVRKSLLTIFARDIERSAEFYGKTIGLRETYRFPRDGAPMHVEFDAGGHTVAVSSDAGLASHGMPASSPGHSFELGLKVDNVDAAVAELRAAGVAVLREPFDSQAGNRVAYIADPDGNWVSMYHNLP